MENWIPLIQEKLEKWWLYIIEMLPNFLLAIIIITFFFIASKLVRRVSNRFILRISKSASLSGLLSGVLSTLVIISGFMTAMDVLGLDKTVSSLLAGVGIIGLALGFAFQDLTSNFISGAFIAVRRPFDVGHTVETNGFLGTIEDIQLRSTTIRTSAGLHVIIPNKDIFQKPIVNYSRSGERRVEFEFVVPNTIDVVFIEKIIKDALHRISTRHSIRGFEFYFTAIENPNMRVNVSFWTRETEPRKFMRVRHKAIVGIYKAFAHTKIYEIKIPEPVPKNELTPH